MRIRKVHISNFGKLQDVSMEFSAGFQVIRGENGWGKSTLAAFMKAMLYGMDATTKRSLLENERRRFTPWQGGSYGGSMEFETGGKRYRAERFWGTKEREDRFVLYDLDTGLESQDFSADLGEELFHIDREAWEKTCYLGSLRTAGGNDSLHARLTKVEEEAGDLKNYEQAVRRLEDRMKYFKKTGNRGHMAQLTEEQRQVRESYGQLLACQQELDRLSVHISEKKEEEKQLRKKTEELEEAERKVHTLEAGKAMREQYRLLKQRAEETEDQLREVNLLLAQYSKKPLEEAELDQIREQLYQLRTDQENLMRLEIQQKEKQQLLERQMEKADSGQEMLEEKKRALAGALGSSAAGFVFLFGARALVHLDLFGNEKASMAAGAAAVLFGGILLLFAMIRIVFGVGKWGKQAHSLRDEKQLLDEQKREIKKLEEKTAQLRADADKNRQALGQVLESEEADASVETLEKRWLVQRESTRTYRQLLAECENRRKIAREHRNAYLEFSKACPDAAKSRPDLDGTEQLSRQQDLRQYQELEKKCRQERGRMESTMELLEQKLTGLTELEERGAALAEQLETEEKTYERLKQTLEFLKRARNQFLGRYLDKLTEGTAEYVRRFAPEWKESLTMDVNLNVKVQEAGMMRELESFSTGWREVFALAERFALVDALCEADEPFLILDDPFVNLDASKYEKAMEILKMMGESRQLIYFTCR